MQYHWDPKNNKKSCQKAYFGEGKPVSLPQNFNYKDDIQAKIGISQEAKECEILEVSKRGV